LTEPSKDCGVTAMEPPGKYLKKERELSGLSIEEAAESTKIREHFLKAIEEDRYERLPPGLYLKGFLMAYAKYLGLDPNDVLLRYKKHLEELNISNEKPLEPEKLEPQKHALFPNKRATLYLLLAIFFTVILFATFLITYIPRLSFPAVPGQKEPMLARIPSRSHIPGERTTQKIEMPESKKMEMKDTIVTDRPNFEVIKVETGTVIGQEGNYLILKGKSKEFTCNNQKIYLLTKIRASERGRITHVWIWRGKEYHKNEIEVKAPEWSVYSYLTLRPHQSGDWKVEVRVGDRVLASLSFNVSAYREYLFEI
jgi:transcriptional regulator with XRE-family HTH domain